MRLCWTTTKTSSLTVLFSGNVSSMTNWSTRWYRWKIRNLSIESWIVREFWEIEWEGQTHSEANDNTYQQEYIASNLECLHEKKRKKIDEHPFHIWGDFICREGWNFTHSHWCARNVLFFFMCLAFHLSLTFVSYPKNYFLPLFFSFTSVFSPSVQLVTSLSLSPSHSHFSPISIPNSSLFGSGKCTYISVQENFLKLRVLISFFFFFPFVPPHVARCSIPCVWMDIYVVWRFSCKVSESISR